MNETLLIYQHKVIE